MPLPHMPTHADLVAFFQRLLPLSSNAKEVSFLWHTPRHPAYNPSLRSTTAVVLSITPTPGFYEANNDVSRLTAPLCFLHRPWTLDRHALRKGSLVLANHASFDEHLTVGWNVALAERLGLNVSEAVCLAGYKGTPDRKIGLVARLIEPLPVATLVQKIRDEFYGVGEFHTAQAADSNSKISVVAIMNAFHVEEIQRVLDAAREKQWIEPDADGSSILYLTGAARDYGLAAIEEINMPGFCVGHRACEEWGIRFIAKKLRVQWPSLEVIEVLEEEEPPPPPKQQKVQAKDALTSS